MRTPSVVLARVLAKALLLLVVAAGLVVLVVPSGTRSGPGRPVLVFAAASLQEAMQALAGDWNARGGRRVELAFAGSATLARQIEAGAPVDVFISADAQWMDHLQAQGRLRAGSRFDLAGNTLVLVAPATEAVPLDPAAPGAIAARLGDRGLLAVADVGSVPAGRYARQALQATGHWDEVEARLSQSDNVRTALNFVARGEAPLGIVYATDARVEPRVAVVARFEPGSHAPIVYPVAGLARSPAGTADDFLAWLRGPEARIILRKHGFSEP